MPTELAATLTLLDGLAAGSYSASGRAGLGVFVLHLNGDTAALKKIVAGLRESLPAGRGSAVVMKGPVDFRKQVDVWGPIGDGLPLMKAVKQRFDPDSLLNRGRGPGGL
jgi:glycolate oxidase FAD binding subunit